MEIVQLVVVKSNDDTMKIVSLPMNDKYKKEDDEEIVEVVLSVNGSITIDLLKNKHKIEGI